MQQQIGLFDAPPAPVYSAFTPGKVKTPRPYQRAGETAVWKELEVHRSTVFVMPTGCGKCLGRGTLVLKSDGSQIPVEEVVRGDTLQGPDGSLRNVLSVNRGTGPLFKITPKKGDPWVCNDVHMLTLVETESGKVVDIPLDEYLRKSKWWKHIHKLFRAPASFHHLDKSSGLLRPTLSHELPIEPYFLGLVLGDGHVHNTSVSVCKPDKEVEYECRRQAVFWGLDVRVDAAGTTSPAYHLVIPKGQRGGRYSRNPLGLALQNLGLDGDPIGKHVPEVYKTASLGCRLQILAGMLDSDGSLSRKGFDWISISEKLANDIVFISRSVGLAAYMRPCVKSCQTGASGTYYRVSISGNTDMIPTRIPRKKAPPRSQKKDALRTGFSVEPIGDGEYFGFTLDEDGRFLLGDFTVTHNTYTFVQLAIGWLTRHKALSDRVLVLANRDELISQGRDALRDGTGEKVGLEQNVFYAHDERIVVASVQTLCQPDRLARWAPGHFGLIICDECDQAICETWDRILNHFADAKVVGCTATPDRTDGKALAKLFDSTAYVYDIEDAIRDKWLCPYTYEVIQIQNIDLSLVRTSGSDFNQEELDAVMVEEALWGIATETLKRAGDRRTLGFTTSADKSVRLAEICNTLRPGCAGAVSYKTDMDERRDILKRHKRDGFQFLWNMGIVSRGYDDPGIRCISMARPTKSRNLMAQMIGRGLRICEGKDGLTVLEFTGNHGRHELACPMDILSGRAADHVVAEAKRKIQEKPGLSTLEALDEARAEDEKRKELARLARSRVQVQVSATSYRYSPLDLLRVKRDAVDEWEDVYGGKTATDKQVAYLRKMKVPIEPNLTCRQARKLQQKLVMRAQYGWASYGQIETLKKYEIDAASLKRHQASKLLDAIAGKGWRKLEPDEYNRIMQRDRIPGEDDA